MSIIESIKDWIASLVVTRLQIGAHCGLCGAWMEHELTYRDWAISICSECNQIYGSDNDELVKG